ncbi:MAG: MFS transporter [Bacteroidetes bacterium]|nr:MFS transporter [Bacteroidota bacterium]
MNLLEHKTGRSLIAFAFYFTEGAPIGFIWWAMPTLLRQNGVELDLITSFTALLTLPWVFKFLWAPLIDFFRTKYFGYKKWIAWSQLGMCLTLVPLLFIPLKGNFICWEILLLLHSLCAATQDVSVDALVINVVSKKETGLLNGYMQAGMLLGRSLFGGAALFFIPMIGLYYTVGIMILTIIAMMSLLFFIKEPLEIVAENAKHNTFKNNLLNVFRKRKTWYLLLFALTAGASFETAGGMCGPFLTDKKLELETIGIFFAIPVVGSMLIGGFIGGVLSDRLSRINSVSLFLAGGILIIAAISVVDILAPFSTVYLWLTLFAGMYLFTGMFTAASYSLFMNASDPKLGATQFSTFMAATNGCEAWVVYSAGSLAVCHGYAISFLVMCVISLLSIFLLKKSN